jgi:hypothetical protein
VRGQPFSWVASSRNQQNAPESLTALNIGVRFRSIGQRVLTVDHDLQIPVGNVFEVLGNLGVGARTQEEFGSKKEPDQGLVVSSQRRNVQLFRNVATGVSE